MQFKLSAISKTAFAAGISLFFGATQLYPATPAFKIIAFYSINGSGEQPDDPAHDNFSHETNGFMPKLGSQNNFTYDSTMDWTKLNDSAFLYQYQIVMFLDDLPAPSEQASLRKYIERNNGFVAFHICAYNYPGDTHAPAWPWYFDTLYGCGEFVNNTWLPTSTQLKVEDTSFVVTKGFPTVYTSEVSEWYSWQNDLRKNPNIKVLCSVDPSGFPVGTDPTQSWTSGYYPIVWTNTKYRMLYCNSGHNNMNYTTNTPLSQTWTNAQHVQLILNALKWLGTPLPTPTRSSTDIVAQRRPEMQIRFGSTGWTMSCRGVNDFRVTIWDLRGNLISQGRTQSGSYSTGNLRFGNGVYIVRASSALGDAVQAVRAP